MITFWKYEPIPRHVLVSVDGQELGEVILDDGPFAGYEIDHNWRVVARDERKSPTMLGREISLEDAKRRLERRGLKAV